MTQAQVPTMVRRYFGENAPHPIIEEAFSPEKGWKRYPIRKRVSATWLRKMQREGYSRVALRANARLADFAISEILKEA